jgi:hypothetical protein
MFRLRAYLNRRAVRETLFFWVLLYLTGAAFIAHAWTGALFATIFCLPLYCMYRLLRWLFVARFPRLCRWVNIPLHKN